jgi:hypothetical protein
MTMEELNMSDSIKMVVTFAIVFLAGVGLIGFSEQLLGTKAVLTEQEKPPASLDVFVLENEVWIRPLDMNGQSTKYPGNAQIEISSIIRANDRGGFSYTPILKNVVHISHFDLVYYNNRGNASNLYAATSVINLPEAKGLYRIQVTYYPTGTGYSVTKEIIRGV